MKAVLRAEWPSIAIVAASWALSAAAWPWLPEAVPVHWNLHGEVDRMGSRAEAALLLPALTTGLAVVLAVVPRLGPNENFRSFRRAYDQIRHASLALDLYVQAVILASAAGAAIEGGRLVAIGVGLLLAWLGNFMGKLRPNGFAGFRTPWTLSSVRSWNVTHRLGGWMFVATGLGTVVAGLASMPLAVGTLVAGALATVLATTVISYRVWRDDPDRTGLGGVHPAE